MTEDLRGAVVLRESERAALLALSRSRNGSHALAQRAEIVLACAEGAGDTAVAGRLGMSRDMVRKWRTRFAEHGLDGLDDRPRAGRPRKVDEAVVARILTRLLDTPPDGAREWSTRVMAAETGLSQATVSRVWREHRLQARSSRGDLRSPFPRVEVRDVAGLFLDGTTRVLAAAGRSNGTPGRAALAPTPQARRLAVRARNLVAVADALTPADSAAPASTAALGSFLEDLGARVPAHVDLYLLVADAPGGVGVRDTLDAWVERHPRGQRRHFSFDPEGSSWLDAAEALLAHPAPLGHDDSTGYGTTLPKLRAALRSWCDGGTPPAGAFAWIGATYDSSDAGGGQTRIRKDGNVIAGGVADAERAASDLSDPVVQELLETLLTATLRSGERVKEAPLADRLGISRRALGKALRVLAGEGLLEALPDGGTAVPRVDIDTVLDLYAVRSALGTLLFRRAAMLHSSELHRIRAALGEVRAIAKSHTHDRIGAADLYFQDMVARTADLPQASLFFQRLTLRLRMFITVLGLDFLDGAVDLIAREDARIFDALREGDGDEAARLWRVKIERSVRYMATQLPDAAFDANLWTTLAGRPDRRAGDPSKPRPTERGGAPA